MGEQIAPHPTKERNPIRMLEPWRTGPFESTCPYRGKAENDRRQKREDRPMRDAVIAKEV
jgi:hypothetical protein